MNNMWFKPYLNSFLNVQLKNRFILVVLIWLFLFFFIEMVFISWVKIIFEPIVCIVVTSIVVKKIQQIWSFEKPINNGL
jgi:hypothetical protein